jgi:acyl-coenzyme A thioesterase PaaI-like protein
MSYLGDISGGLACISVMKDPSHSSVTVELKANFLKPAIGNYLIGKGKVIS